MSYNHEKLFPSLTKDNSEYVELFDNSIIERNQLARESIARDEKDRKLNEPENNLDWFLKGDVDKLESNLTVVTNPVDQGRIRLRIGHLKKEPEI